MSAACEPQVMPVASLREWFRASIHGAIVRQNVRADPHTEHYIVELLTAFARSENFFERHRDGFRLRPLALMLAEALEARSAEERSLLLQRLGDVSLFMLGFFAEGLARGPADADYYNRMGETAYGALCELPPRTRRHQVLAGVFRELAERFTRFAEVLAEVAQKAHVSGARDVLLLYELWARTGSRRAAAKLRELGIVPVAPAPGRAPP
ncbi:MAG: hypothetical protein AB1452_17365 [Pseudomonadota bacterium]